MPPDMKTSEHGPVTVRRNRKRLSLSADAKLVFVASDDRLFLKKSTALKRKVWEKNYGILKTDGLRTDDIMRELRDR